MGIFRVGFQFSVFSFQSRAVIEPCFSHLLATTIPWDIAGDARARRRRAKRFLMKSTAGVCVLCRLWAFRLRHGIFGYRGISGQMAPTRAVAGATACPPPRLRSTEVAEEGEMREYAAAQAKLTSKYVCPLSYSLGIFRAGRARFEAAGRATIERRSGAARAVASPIRMEYSGGHWNSRPCSFSPFGFPRWRTGVYSCRLDGSRASRHGERRVRDGAEEAI